MSEQTETVPAPDDPAAGRLGFQLTYGDCDTVGISFFAIYYRWMERCYTTWLYAQGLRSAELVDDLGVLIVGLSSGARYLQTVTVFDYLTCQAVAQRIGSTSYTVGFEFSRAGQPVTVGQMTFAVRAPDFTKTEIPPRLRAVLGRLPEPTVEGA